jgi:predicted transcriptional regulator
MIDFACKQFDLDEIIKCAFGLSKADIKVMRFLIKNENKSFSSDEISAKLMLDLTTIQRAVKKLSEKSVIFRSQENLDNGGYIFIYRIKSRKAISETVMNIVNNWSKKVEHELESW